MSMLGGVSRLLNKVHSFAASVQHAWRAKSRAEDLQEQVQHLYTYQEVPNRDTKREVCTEVQQAHDGLK